MLQSAPTEHLTKELHLVDLSLSWPRNTKSSHLWSFRYLFTITCRKWLTMLIYNSLADESSKSQFVQEQITTYTQAAARYPCNYFAWSYRAETLLPLLIKHNLLAIELHCVIQFTALNILDTSAWHYLATLLLHANNEEWWSAEFTRSKQLHMYYHNMRYAVIGIALVGRQRSWISQEQLSYLMAELKVDKKSFN